MGKRFIRKVDLFAKYALSAPVENRKSGQRRLFALSEGMRKKPRASQAPQAIPMTPEIGQHKLKADIAKIKSNGAA